MRYLLVLIALGALAPGCAAVKKYGTLGGTAAAGGAGGALVGGPVGAAVGAGVAAIAFGAIVSEEEYRSGDSLSKEALERELARWRNDAWAADQRAREKEKQAEATKSWADSIIKWSLISAAAYFVLRNRQHIFQFGPGYLSRLWHSFVGGKRKATV